MQTVSAALHVLQQNPIRIDEGGAKHPGTTAYYVDVPATSMPASCKITRTGSAFNIEGDIEDCSYRGQAIEGATSGHFRRVILSFVKRAEPVPMH